MAKTYYVYILTNAGNNVLYTGVTNDLIRRIDEHKTGFNYQSFTSRYRVNKLVYYECFDSVENAIAREKQIKGGSRQKKLNLITSINPDWCDLMKEFEG